LPDAASSSFTLLQSKVASHLLTILT